MYQRVFDVSARIRKGQPTRRVLISIVGAAVQEGVHRVDNAANIIFVARSAYSDPLGLVLELGRQVEGHHENRNFR